MKEKIKKRNEKRKEKKSNQDFKGQKTLKRRGGTSRQGENTTPRFEMGILFTSDMSATRARWFMSQFRAV